MNTSLTKKIAVVAGGYSSEHEVSLKSANTVLTHLSPDKYEPYLVVIHQNKWVVKIGNKELNVDKNDFSFTLNEVKTTFDCAYITLHGTPGEDGKLQGYFDMIGLPYTTCSQEISALTFNKWLTSQVLMNNGIPCAKSMIFRRGDEINPKKIADELGLPCFVKPNDGGSSYGISKVKNTTDILPAVEKAFGEGNQVVIESFLEGKEFTCGAYRANNTVYTLPVTEIVSKNEYFDYDAKYHGLSDEITPARLSPVLTEKIQKLTEKIARLLHLRGIIRIDFMLVNDTPHVIEINTTPGMSAASLIPQQVAVQEGLTLSHLLDLVIQEALGR